MRKQVSKLYVETQSVLNIFLGLKVEKKTLIAGWTILAS